MKCDTTLCRFLSSRSIRKNDRNRNEFSEFVIYLKLIYSLSQLFDESMLGDFSVDLMSSDHHNNLHVSIQAK